METIEKFLSAAQSFRVKQEALRDEAAAIEKEALEVYEKACELAESKTKEADALDEQIIFATIAENAVIAVREEKAKSDERMHAALRSFAEKMHRDYSVPRQEFVVIADQLGFDLTEKESEIEEAAA